MKKKTIFYVGVYAVIIYGGWYLYNNTKKAYAHKILNAGFYGAGEAPLLNFDKDFLKEWSKSAVKGVDTFVYNGITYNTKGGTSVKSSSKSVASNMNVASANKILNSYPRTI